MSLLKSAPTPESPIAKPIAQAPQESTMSVEWRGVPLEVASFFNVEVTKADTKTLDMLKDINTWTQDNPDSSMGDRLLKIRSLESKLGSPTLNESRIAKAWNWIKMDMSLKELRKRQKAYEA